MSTRSAKRRRISDPESPNLPLSTRAFRAVKAALVGKPLTKPSQSPPSNAIVSSVSETALSVEPRITRYGGERQLETKGANDELPTHLEQETTETEGKADGEGPGKLNKPDGELPTHLEQETTETEEKVDGEGPGKSNKPDGAYGVLVDAARNDANKDVLLADRTSHQSKPLRRSKRQREQSESESQDESQNVPQSRQRRRFAVKRRPTRAKPIRASKRSKKAIDENEQPAETNGVEDNQTESQRVDTIASRDASSTRASNSESLYPTPSKRSSGKIQKQPRRSSIEIGQSTKPAEPPKPGSGRKRGRPRKDDGSVSLRGKAGKFTNSKNISANENPVGDSVNETSNKDIETTRLGGPTRLPEAFSTPRKQHKKSPALSEQTPLPAIASTAAVQGPLNQDEEYTLKEATLVLRRMIKEDTSGVLTILKTRILEGLTGKRRLPLVNLETEYQKVHQLVEQTVLAGEGNSMLIIGSRGTAKTTLVETVIADVALDHGDEFHVVRLNGFIHTDDKLALREIWRQLGREMEVEDDSLGIRSNYADTLISLLALLSHPAEAAADGNQAQTSKSIIFVLEEFDLFASHPRQTLLYNLFDVAQSRNAPIAVLGITTKIDVVNSLEKRVKSRFGQRYVYLSLPRTLPAFQAICQSALIPQNSQTPISTLLAPPNQAYQSLLSAWTAYITALFTSDAILKSHLLKTYTLSKSIPTFLTSSLLPIAALPLLPTGPSFQPLSPPDSKLHLLPALSDLALALLIAAARLDIVLDADLCNFALCYEEYVMLASRSRAQSSAAGALASSGGRVWGREVARAQWEVLVHLELVLPVGGKGEGMWRVEVALEEIAVAAGVGGGRGGMEKWCKEI